MVLSFSTTSLLQEAGLNSAPAAKSPEDEIEDGYSMGESYLQKLPNWPQRLLHLG